LSGFNNPDSNAQIFLANINILTTDEFASLLLKGGRVNVNFHPMSRYYPKCTPGFTGLGKRRRLYSAASKPRILATTTRKEACS
jgi:hypothetical protein